jgi:hypothetical protein
MLPRVAQEPGPISPQGIRSPEGAGGYEPDRGTKRFKGKRGPQQRGMAEGSRRAVLDYFNPGLKDAYSKIRQLILWFLAIGVYS